MFIRLNKEAIILLSVILAGMVCPTWSFLPERAEDEYHAMRKHFPRMTWEIYETVYATARRLGIDYKLVLCIIWRESNFKNVKSKKNKNGTHDLGIMQVNNCHRVLAEPMDIVSNIRFGCRYLFYCFRSGTIADAVRRYNQGLNGKRKDYKNWRYVAEVLNKYIEVKK